MVYEYRTHQLVVRRAQKQGTEPAPRTILEHKPKTGFGILVFLCLAAVGSSIIYTSLEKQDYGSCVYGKVQLALQKAQQTKTPVDTQRICEKAKGTCSASKTETPCTVTCSDRGLPDTSQCN